MFQEMRVKTFYIGKSLEDTEKANLMFQAPKDIIFNI